MFIDTSVLVNARILEAPQHDVARASLEQAFAGPEALRISRQIVREYLAVVTRPQSWPVPITREQALEDAGRLLAVCPRNTVSESMGVKSYEHLVDGGES